MTENAYSRHIQLEAVMNFRDLGGYRTREGKRLVWRRLFRSGELQRMTESDLKLLRDEIGLKSVIDLRSRLEIEKQGQGRLSEAGVKFENIPLIPDGGDKQANERRYRNFTNMGQFYLDLMRQPGYGESVVEALEIIATAENHPLVFHCAVGKDRTGIVAALLLNLLGVPDEDIIGDYALSAEPMKALLNDLKNGPGIPPGTEELPDYFWEAAPDSMSLFLNTLKTEYGSIQDYLMARGAELSLAERLKQALLT